jgi:hypothetical protein
MKLNFNNPISKSGKQLTPLPKQNISIANYDKKFTLWLIENAKLETKGNNHLTFLLNQIKTDKKGQITISDKDNLNDILFGQTNIEIYYEKIHT